MDFIERIFHVAPDGGTGTLELAIALIVLIVPLVLGGLRLLALRKKTYCGRTSG
jgi:hypothetical protein